ncbi:hypothetical protein H310_09443 [Aphanomyces invadans]|uniref:Uncharacterized protein n=1 Tax=Aphanomyces invadans TaxID=157072 RepID=A0A024TU67_9STRA|nr:hypothetical protein H310_09443 [Aphanomyces invadans]ETV97529.1 hypothetical protein H310_09443 [Aphanomyces invadans]|eukprot:XP_008873738.1 hypothetical protein H310_09443 [Aphanomyces invadans]
MKVVADACGVRVALDDRVNAHNFVFDGPEVRIARAHAEICHRLHAGNKYLRVVKVNVRAEPPQAQITLDTLDPAIPFGIHDGIRHPRWQGQGQEAQRDNEHHRDDGGQPFPHRPHCYSGSPQRQRIRDVTTL